MSVCECVCVSVCVSECVCALCVCVRNQGREETRVGKVALHVLSHQSPSPFVLFSVDRPSQPTPTGALHGRHSRPQCLLCSRRLSLHRSVSLSVPSVSFGFETADILFWRSSFPSFFLSLSPVPSLPLPLPPSLCALPMAHVAVVGSGASGLAAALALRRSGHSVTVLSDRPLQRCVSWVAGALGPAPETASSSDFLSVNVHVLCVCVCVCVSVCACV